MPALRKVTAVTALAISSVFASPLEPSAKLSTHRQHLARGNSFTSYHPPVTYEVLSINRPLGQIVRC